VFFESGAADDSGHWLARFGALAACLGMPSTHSVFFFVAFVFQ
jgi:hypothetical protein